MEGKPTRKAAASTKRKLKRTRYMDSHDRELEEINKRVADVDKTLSLKTTHELIDELGTSKVGTDDSRLD